MSTLTGFNVNISRALFSQARSDWGTPDELIDKLHFYFGFDLDAAADGSNYRFASWLGEGGLAPNALDVRWSEYGERAFCNPPYGRNIGKWLEKGRELAKDGGTAVFLLPARTDTKWFHEFSDAERIFLKGRLRFKGASAPAPFPSMLLVFKPKLVI